MHGAFHTGVPMSHKPQGRKLRLVDLTGIGLAAPFGLGIYILAGHVVHAVAGPAAFISAIFAAIVATLAGLSYLEFSFQFPDTRGSASFVFTHCGVGELLASLVAWNLAIDYVIGGAAAARGVRAALDELLGGVLRSTFLEVAPLDPSLASPYFDFAALVLPLLAAAVLVASPRRYVAPQVAVCALTLVTAMFAVVAGSLEADSVNWSLHPENVTELTGEGGFLPFGFPRVLSGAAIFVFVFVGVDHIAVTERQRQANNDEVKGHLQWFWPVLVVITCAICFMLGLAIVLSFMLPYYELDENAALVMTFSALEWSEARWIICLVGIVALSTMVVSGLSGSARLLRSMAEDDLLWSGFGEVTHCGVSKPFYTVPAIALVTGLLGAFVEEHQLVSVLSGGTLLAFVAVQASLILHKCRGDEGTLGSARGVSAVIKQLVPRKNAEKPTATSSAAAALALAVYCVSVCIACAVAVYAEQELRFGRTWAVSVLTTSVLLSLLALVCLAAQPHVSLHFTALLWPVLPCAGIFGSLYLLMSLQLIAAWTRLALVSAIGLSLYAARRWSLARHRSVSAKLLTNGSSTPAHSTTLSIDVEQHTVTSQHSCTGTQSSATSHLHDQCVSEELDPHEAPARADDLNNAEKIELFSEESGFDEQKWNKIWEYNNSKDATFDPDFDSESLRDEAVVAEVHESTHTNVTPTEDTTFGTPTLEVKKSSKHVVVVLPDGSSTETSDSENTSPVHGQSPSSSLSSSRQPSPSVSPKPPPLPMGNVFNSHKSPSVSPKSSLSPSREPSPPLSPIPPPLPMGNTINKPYSDNSNTTSSEESSRDTTVQTRTHQSKPAEAQSSMRSLQEELKTTLRLRNQKKIDEIENTVVNVSEGIEIFGGGRRSRTTSLTTDVSIKSAMKAGKFEDAQFVSKLNSILKTQMGEPRSAVAVKRAAPPPPRPRDVVLVTSAGDEVTRRHKEQMRGALEQVLSQRRDIAPSTKSVRSEVAPKSLDALVPKSEIQIVSRNSDIN